ncbi:PucR family transcriptional regulator ligand-binding domain-containing protein [Sedimentibacter sp.]|uniref:PucR family transcriptional regulator n=1 Tax=Sedimentibacter sp. TaxID=1960295 RepID=UPI0028A0D614|nr:PucR family transcriptional regulator ligand-binding domain-containing protein [Sedimentibacter sp.]
MQITVKQVLELEVFKNAKVVAGKDGLTNIVRNATLMEVPDIFPYIDSQSILITTLYPIYSNEDAINELIPKLVELNLSGICIKPARYIDEIPKSMIRQADNLNFPIIELPSEANLSKLISEILEISLKKHIEILNFRNLVHERLMELFLKGENIDVLVNNLSDIVGYPIILIDNDLNVICSSLDLINRNISVLYDTIVNNKLLIKIDGNEYKDGAFIKYSINAGKTRFGDIILLKEETDSESLKLAIEQASFLIASVFYKNFAVLEKERSLQDSFIRDILNGKIESGIDVINEAKNFGWKLEFPQVIMVVKLLIDNEKKKKEIYEELMYSKFIERVLNKKMLSPVNDLKTVYIDNSLVVFINSIFIKNSKKSFVEVGNLIIDSLKNRVKVGIGISNAAENIESFSLVYKEAHNSLIAGSVLNKNSFVSHYDDYEMFKIIKEVKDMDILNAYVNKKIGKIIDYDKTNDMKLMETLKVLIEENFNAKSAAQKLYIHYNTLRYRIIRIKELGIDIENGFEIGELVLAYNIYLWIMANKK